MLSSLRNGPGECHDECETSLCHAQGNHIETLTLKREVKLAQRSPAPCSLSLATVSRTCQLRLVECELCEHDRCKFITYPQSLAVAGRLDHHSDDGLSSRWTKQHSA